MEAASTRAHHMVYVLHVWSSDVKDGEIGNTALHLSCLFASDEFIGCVTSTPLSGLTKNRSLTDAQHVRGQHVIPRTCDATLGCR